MLTRLKIKGFKNLADVDVSFGPFTCVAGANAVGKSNLFDAITFFGALADQPLMDAAKCVRDEKCRSTDVRSLFLAAGDQHVEEISFEAEMLVPPEGADDLGQEAKAAITFLKYSLSLRYHSANGSPSAERLEIIEENRAYQYRRRGFAPAVPAQSEMAKVRRTRSAFRKEVPVNRGERRRTDHQAASRRRRRPSSGAFGKEFTANRAFQHNRRGKPYSLACAVRDAFLATASTRANGLKSLGLIQRTHAYRQRWCESGGDALSSGCQRKCARTFIERRVGGIRPRGKPLV